MLTAKRSGGAYVIANAGGWGNIGDDAITVSLIQGIAAFRDEARFALLSGPDNSDITASSAHAITVLSHPGPLRRTRSGLGLVTAGALVVGGGGLLQDRLPEFYRPYHRAMRIAKLCRVPLSITSVGVSPPRTSAFRSALQDLTDYASHFTVRDPASAEILSDVTGRPAPRIVPDAAFGLRVPPDPPERSATRAACVGVALRPWWHLPQMWGRADPDRFGRLLARIAGALRSVRRSVGCDFLLIPMHIGTSDDDRHVAHLLEKELSDDGYVRHAPVAGVVSAIEAIQTCDALVGMRLHSLILAAMCEVPSVAIAYDEKILRAMDRLGRAHFVSTIDELEPEWLANSLSRALESGMTAVESRQVRRLRGEAHEEQARLAANHIGGRAGPD
jgi:polysaccharide pyruvyl transferase WcaK-like protein